ncbi:cytochrome b/b6 domain-containing protein [Dokdonella sp.]|uniref:cytochrome b/b6 domain-containing protein n=1 Tax=Dokdonella sp. TaxID=2291710 RepID=UPI002F40E736
MSVLEVRVWDGFVRLFHWSLVIAFFVAYFTEPEDATLSVHVWAGYFVGGLIVLRVIWGFIGSRHARFSDFAFGPFRALAYLGNLVRGRSKRHLGHSPAGAWMVYLLLAALTATVLTGLVTLATEENQGPLAPFFGGTSASAMAEHRDGDDDEDRARPAPASATGEHRESSMEELHEILANIVLVLVALHIAGVIVASVAHRENLVRAMITGDKRADEVRAES